MDSNKYVNPEWEKAEKKVDPDFDGSVWKKVGLAKYLCPTCGAHLSQELDGPDLICLNACHLIPEAQERFHQLWSVFASEVNYENVIRLVEESSRRLDDLEKKGDSDG